MSDGWWLVLLALGVGLAWLWRQNRRLEQRGREAEAEAARQRRLAETLLEQTALAEDRARRVEAVSHDAILILNDQRRIVALNAAAGQLFTGVKGKALIEVLRDADLNQAVVETLADGRRRNLTLSFGGRAYQVSLANGSGGVALALQDVTELYRLTRARRDFVANISHELRTPLTSLGLLCDALLATVPPDDASQQLAQTITDEVSALTHLVTDMLDLSQIEDGRMLVRLAPVGADELVETSVARIRPQAARRQVTLTSDVSPDWMVLADFEKAGRVLTNLLDNAVKYSPLGGQVWVNAARVRHLAEDGYDIVFSVRDTGPGIAAADLPRVFERFFKVDRARERGGGMGAGLGLAIARHLVEAHGGRIWVESVEGKGATFFFTLPEA